MEGPPPDVRAQAERLLGHPVPVLLWAPERPLVAVSAAGDPPRARIAWLEPDDGRVVARVACPPGRPSRWRPVVASVVELTVSGAPADRVLVARTAAEAVAVRPLLAVEGPPHEPEAADAGLVAVRLPASAAVLGVDALDARGEPIGRLARPGLAELRTDGNAVSGRLGASHGMAAGIGHGHWAATLEDAAFEAGYRPVLPEWLPGGLTASRPRIEPDICYPAAPPAVIMAWTAPDAGRVLLRQAPAPLASPDPGGRGAREVDVGGAAAVLRGRGLVTLVWETAERAFGLQVRGMEHAERLALRVARSIPPLAGN